MKIELVFEACCPNAQALREMLQSIGAELGLDLRVIEVNKDDVAAPDYATNLSSPTLLVDGKDVVQDGSHGGNACRVYRTNDGRLTGVPPREMIVAALKRSQRKRA